MWEFAANISSTYRAEYCGHEDMTMELALFGNGKSNTQGGGTTTIENAPFIIRLMADIESVEAIIKTLERQEGFTNMVQGSRMADVKLGHTRRDGCDQGHFGQHVLHEVSDRGASQGAEGQACSDLISRHPRSPWRPARGLQEVLC